MSLVRPSSALGALFRFHLRSTVRVTLRNTAVQAVLVCVLVGMTPDPDYLVAQVANLIVQGDPAVLALWAAWLWGNAAAALGPLCSTLSGWHRHLALGRADRRRATLVALVCCQGPVLVSGLVLWFLGYALAVGGDPHWQVAPSWTGLAALVCSAPLTAASAVGWRPWPTAMITWAGLVAVLAAGPVGLLLGTVSLVAVDRLDAAPAVDGKRRPKQRRRKPSRAPGFLLWRLAWRSVGLRTVVPAWFWAAVALGCVALFIRNNDLQSFEKTIGARVGASLGLIAVWLPVAGEMRKARPPWPWFRSLPMSSRERLLWDAGFLTLLSVPVWIGAGLAAPWAVPPLVLATVFQTVRLATALRCDAQGVTRLGAAAVAEVWVVQVMVAAWPWPATCLAVAVVPALAHGARLEQGMKVSRFRERHHALQGDTTP